jgi:hypothetical protein
MVFTSILSDGARGEPRRAARAAAEHDPAVRRLLVSLGVAYLVPVSDHPVARTDRPVGAGRVCWWPCRALRVAHLLDDTLGRVDPARAPRLQPVRRDSRWRARIRLHGPIGIKGLYLLAAAVYAGAFVGPSLRTRRLTSPALNGGEAWRLGAPLANLVLLYHHQDAGPESLLCWSALRVPRLAQPCRPTDRGRRLHHTGAARDWSTSYVGA